MGPLIKTYMTRCIQCTRCVRFITEVAGVPEIGLISRGEDVEITTYLESAVTSELSGNVNDLCPVGALTHRPWQYEYRPWELKKTQSIDVHDAMGAAIRVDSRGPAVLRVLPRVNDEINEEWLSDKSRYAVDGLARQRLDRPYVREGGKLRPATWAEALDVVAAKIKATSGDRIGVIAGDLQDAESMKAALDLFKPMGAHLTCNQDGAPLGAGPRESWLFNSTIAGIEDADVVLLVGTNPRLEAPVLNARLRKRWLAGQMRIGLIGEQADLTYDYDYLGAGPTSIGALTAKKILKSTPEFAKALKGAQRPAIIVGMGALGRPDGAAVLKAAADLAAQFNVVREGWNGWNVLHTSAARVGGLDMGFTGAKTAAELTGKGGADLLFLLGADEVPLKDTKAFTVYLGTHGDNGAHRADVILPGAAYTEKNGLYVNMEGRVQMGERAIFPKGEGREDWAILRALSEKLGATLPYDSLDQLRAKLFADHPTFGRIDYVAPATSFDLGAVGGKGELIDAPFLTPVKAFHLTNPIARASVTMAECAALASGASKMAAE
ncbi:MAG: molybdopterin-dependent oxidoreductase, partial [Ignavibacteriales bacterium]